MTDRELAVFWRVNLDYLCMSSYFQQMTTMRAQVHIIVEGLVQGVGFRWFVLRQAESLGLVGHVRNLVDGRVEILAGGEKGLLHELVNRVRVGPRSAHVSGVRIEWLPDSPDTGKGESTAFEIR